MWALRQLVFRVTFLAKALSARVTHFDTRRSLRIRYGTSVHRHMFHHLFSDGRLSPPIPYRACACAAGAGGDGLWLSMAKLRSPLVAM